MEKSEFERERDRLVGEIAETLAKCITNINQLNRNIENVSVVGYSFAPVHALWKQFESVMANSGEKSSLDYPIFPTETPQGADGPIDLQEGTAPGGGDAVLCEKRKIMSDTLHDVPEFFEVEIGEAVLSRTDHLGSFTELGPPDLCHVVKSSSKSGVKDLSSYHYVSGVDASSSASLAAYLNSLTYTVEEAPGWFFSSSNTKSTYKITGGVYCCFNAFSRVDVRVEVNIPGGVDAYVIDIRGERHEATPEIWQEVYLSALLRAFLYVDDPNYSLAGYRRLEPITSLENEIKFITTAEQLFFKAWQLGSDPEIQVATLVSNHLTSGLMKYFSDSGRYGPAVNLFEKLVIKEGEVASLLAQSYLGINEEVKAVRILQTAIQKHPQSYSLLHTQCDFLRGKGKMEWALQLARQAVNCAPSEFVTWEKLTRIHIEMGDFNAALLTLNSCPMFSYHERDLHRMPAPARSHLPIKEYIVGSGLLDDSDTAAEHSNADVTLLRLPAPSLRGTFAKAYDLLTEFVGHIGWDELLKCRSRVFVMEEEYRARKASEPAVAVNGSSYGVPSVNGKGELVESAVEGFGPLSVDEDEPRSIPTIRVSSEDDEAPSKPVVAQAPADDANDAEKDSFQNKRLCERWLDNLFMVLYEDLRVYTIWRAEMAHFRAQSLPYKKTGTEWEILGDLAERLHHKEEAKEAYLSTLDLKFSPKAWHKLLEYYTQEGDVQNALNAAIRLSVYNHRWYLESAYPNTIAKNLFALIKKNGLAKTSYSLVSMNVPHTILKSVMQPYFAYAQSFKVEGSEF